VTDAQLGGEARSGSRRRARVAGTIVGAALVVAAGWVIWDQQGQDGIANAWGALVRAPLWMHLVLVASVGAIALGATLTHFLLMRRCGEVGFREMLALILSATLLNYAPLRPGLVGRVAYHRAVNQIAIGATVRALIWANVLIVGAAVALLVGVGGPASLWGDSLGVALAPIGVVALPLLVAPLLPERAYPELVRLLALRTVELTLWGLRFWACFALVGEPITWTAAVLLAAAHTLTLMIPISGNGLGVSEWFLGVGAALLPPALLVGAGSAGGAFEASDGMLAALVSRLVEVALIVPGGLIGGAFVAKRVRSGGPAQSPE
jgi:hypothetical protein